VQAFVAAAWREAGHEVSAAPVGNLLAKVGGEGKRLVVVAHADEIAVVVKSVTAGGHCLVLSGSGTSAMLRQPPNPMILGQNMTLMGRHGPVPAVLAARAGHLRSTMPDPAGITWNDLFLDLGVGSADEVAALGIHPGCPACFDVATRRLGSRIVGKAMDDRAALAIATELGRRARGRKLGYELYIASTVQEENGLIGATALGASDAPFDLAISLDVGLCGDVPGVGLGEMPVRLGGGPVVVHKDNSVRYHRELSYALVATGERRGIALQHAAFQGYGSDSAALFKSNIPAALVAYPTRYTHTAIETVDEGDLEACVALLLAFCEEAPF
ncbi:MAG TPA: M42 family peptidase, partial [Bacillota bacterium]|nr:M42 family peptidase [Bacillota bacterium]